MDLCKKFQVEPRGLCLDCDMKKRLSFRSSRHLFARKCDATGKQILSMYSPDKPYKVYDADYWWSDKWDALQYGREMDFNRPFFDQLHELQLAVPRYSLTHVQCENSDFCTQCVGDKNCYLIFGGDFNQDCLYGTWCMNNRDSLDLDLSHYNELCYMLGDSTHCYNCQYVFDSRDCTDCYFVTDCIGCNNCILCSNLKNASYCIRNKHYSKEEYLKLKDELITGSSVQRQALLNELVELKKSRVVKYAHVLNCQDCEGEYLQNCKNCINCFDVSNSEDCYNVMTADMAKDIFNSCYVGYKSELAADSIAMAEIYNIKHCYSVFRSSEVEYGDCVMNSKNIFGCVSLNKKEYCILNKQYSREDYFALRAKIIEHMKKTGEWGKFLPEKMSCYGYNESTANDYFPLSEAEALKQCFQWSHYPSLNSPAAAQEISAELPDNINDARDEILAKPVLCEASGKPFKILKQELEFYRKHRLPLPRVHSEERYKLRQSLRNPLKLWSRACAKCNAAIRTSYAPDRPETVYCEQCFLKEVY